MAPKKPGRPPAKATAKAKATTAAAPAVPLRRSSRQATKTAKASEDEIVVAPARVTKKASPKKAASAKATPAKPAAKKATPKKPAATKAATARSSAKKAVPKKITPTGVASKKTGAPKRAYAESDAETRGSDKSTQHKADFRKAFAPSKAPATARRPAKAAVSKTTAKKPAAKKTVAAGARESAAPASPGRRGRPRKATSAASTASQTSGISKSTRTTRKKPATRKPEVAAPDDNEDWTDSPKKTSPNKRQSKVSTKSAATVKKLLEVREQEHRVGEMSRAGSVGGVKNSIEPTERTTTKRARSKSPARGASKGPTRRPTKTSKGKAAAGSGSVSPARSVRTRSQSPSKTSKPRQTSKQAAHDADQFLQEIGEDLSDAAIQHMTRQRTASPARSIPNKSPPKGGKGKGVAKPASRNASRSPSASAVPKPLRVQKARPRLSRSPSKNQSPSPRRSSHRGSSKGDEGTESPIFSYGAGGLGEVIPERVQSERSPESKWMGDILDESDPVYPDAGEEPRSSRSPSRGSSVRREFNHEFHGDHEYGGILRMIEADAYQSTKNNQELMGRAEYVTEDDQHRAQQKGIQRANDEAYMRTFDGSAGKRAKRAKPAKQNKPSRSPRRSPTSGKRERRGSDYRPPGEDDDNDGDDDDDVDPGRDTPKRPAPARKGRKNSASAYRPERDERDDDDENIDAANGSFGRSGSTRKRRTNSQGAYRPVDNEDDDQDFDELGRPFRQSTSRRKLPPKNSPTTGGVTKSKRRSPATVRKQGGWLGNRSRPSLVAQGKSNTATNPATAEKRSSPARRSQSPAKMGASAATKAGRSRSAHHPTANPERDPNDRLPPNQPSAPGRGTIRSVTNPEIIPGTNVKNPLFETMPGPEVWHRNMPAVFPYGETPFMQREMSRRIEEDLAGGAGEGERGSNESPGFFSRMKERFWPSPARQRPPAWELPEVSDAEVEQVVQEMNRTQHSVGGVSNGRKRKAATEARSVSPRKRAQSRSTGGRRSA